MFLFKRNWNTIKVGDKVKAKKDVPALMEPAIQFEKGEIAEVVEIRERSIGIIDRYKDISYFAKRPLDIDFIGVWFK